MSNRPFFGALAVGVLFLAVAVGAAIGAYNAGVAQGFAESGRMIAAPPVGTPIVYLWPRPWGFGFFPFFPLFFLIVFFFVVRGRMWRGRWHGGPRYRYEGVPPIFEEWHRRAHAHPASASDPGSRTTDPGSRTTDPGTR
jgi:hypothetical protein